MVFVFYHVQFLVKGFDKSFPFVAIRTGTADETQTSRNFLQASRIKTGARDYILKMDS